MTGFRLGGSMEDALERVTSGLRQQADIQARRGLGVPQISGKLLRPMVAWALLPADRRRDPGGSFWSGALAIQMVHEASLLHDDVIDGASRRRGAPALHERDGVGAAVVAGDRYLTSSYVVATEVRSRVFMERFTRAVERTVEGEHRQGAARGRFLDEDTYESLIRGKSGELFGAAAVLASVVGGEPVPVDLGLRIGSLYQRVDDLLDYCTSLRRDKPALQDWRQRKWTFPLGLAGVDRWELPEADVLNALRTGPTPPLFQGVVSLEDRARRIVSDAERAIGDARDLADILESWCGAARTGVEHDLAATGHLDAATGLEQAS
ncbi:MAG TPA: polyprenyl synthetase family protein [Longimicrobiales bacterium]|nr:polyprenyl synthetase family protein [Longimicrobiales bacterium]